MVRRRTVTLSLTAAALVLAAPLITSCAQHPGSAAVVGGSTISVTELQNQVTQLRHAQSASGQQVALSGADGGLNRLMLDSLVGYRVLDRAAAAHHVTVTQGQIETAVSMDEQRFGGKDGLRDLLLERAAVAPGAPTQTFFRSQIQRAGIARAIGADLNTAQGQQQVDTELSRTAATLHVDVNPRYGTWHAEGLAIGNTTSHWLDPATVPAKPASVTG